MGQTLSEVAQQLKNNNKNVQLIYAFNGTGKTRLSREFKNLINSITEDADDELDLVNRYILYYNAFTEDLFYWDNDLENDIEPKLKIQNNTFTDWVLVDQGQDQNVISNFNRYTNDKLAPRYIVVDKDRYINGKLVKSKTFTGVTFSFERGNDEIADHIKISKGEESNFIWCVFYSMLEQIIYGLNEVYESDDDPSDIEHEFSQLEYVFIDDPVSSLDDSHLIELAVDLAKIIKLNKSKVKFIITTHNPLFYNVLCNELGRSDKYYDYKANSFKKYRLDNLEDGTFLIDKLPTDSPFSYHLSIKNEIEKSIQSGNLKKYHFNLLRNILEKTATFLGYDGWVDILPKSADGRANPYQKRMLDLFSHSKHSGEEAAELTNDEKRVLSYLMNQINIKYQFKKINTISEVAND